VQAGASGTGIEKTSAFKNGIINWNTNSDAALGAFGYCNLLVAKYNAIGGLKSKLGLPTVRSMSWYFDGLTATRIAFCGGTVWIPLDTARAYAQY